MKKKILNWIEEKRKSIVDPDNEGFRDDEIEFLELDEREQTELQLLDEFEEFIKALK